MSYQPLGKPIINRRQRHWRQNVVIGTVLGCLLSLLAMPPVAAQEIPVTRIEGADRIATAVAISGQAFQTATTVVMAGGSNSVDALVGGPLAASLGAPLLLTATSELPQIVADELKRLDAEEVVLLGGLSAISDVVADRLSTSGLEVTRVAGATRYETAARVAQAMPAWDGAFVASGTSPVDAVVAGAVAASRGWPVLLVEPDSVPDDTRTALIDNKVDQVIVIGGEAVVSSAVEAALAELSTGGVIRIGGVNRYHTATLLHEAAVRWGDFEPETIWLASGQTDHLADALTASPVVASQRASLLLVNGDDLHAERIVVERLRTVAPEVDEIVLLGGPAAINAAAPSQIDAVLNGVDLPGGGRSLLPDNRLVALYGSHFTPALGVLGEQAPSQLGPRLDAIVDPYRELSDRPILPALDLIATIATASAGADGLYRSRSTDPEIQQWLDAARANDAYLILDLQPGRSDFLTEAQAYERFLREPDVGLALDPEWRTTAPQRPGGGTIGSVSAAEINAVSAWLSDLVAEEQLPEKLLIIHNFRVDMVTDRQDVTASEGLAVLFHMDGQGGRNVKLDSYRILRQTSPFYNGFKIFFDEDPNPFQPAEVLNLDPVPDFISYQ
ncbi:hypothetical protein BH24ACT15_BH24ACT15_18430 [soil metagenome]